MRYTPDHKARTRRRIVASASRQVREKGLGGPGVARLMKGAGLSHGGFYKHFRSKDDLLVEAIAEGFREVGDTLVAAAERAPAGEGWKEIVKQYLTVEHCEHPGHGCPIAALAEDIAHTPGAVKTRIDALATAYRERLRRYMPGRNAAEQESNYLVIFSAMAGAMAMARMMTDGKERQRVLHAVREHLLAGF